MRDVSKVVVLEDNDKDDKEGDVRLGDEVSKFSGDNQSGEGALMGTTIAAQGPVSSGSRSLIICKDYAEKVTYLGFFLVISFSLSFLLFF